eukprot:5714354-Pyramimonas_sp.AAC.1
MEVTDPKLRFGSGNLDLAEKCQAITKIAEIHGHPWIPFTGKDLATMSSTGKSVTDFFQPLTQMENGSYRSWSCSVHIVSDSTITFKDASGAPKPSLMPEYHMRNSVFGSAQSAKSGALLN